MRFFLYRFLFCCLLSSGCQQQDSLLLSEKMVYSTKKAIVLVIDGPRYSDTWQSGELIPYLSDSLAPQGTFFSNFRNQGTTYTVAGHTAITTGFYQHPNNDGTEIPAKPSFFQHYLEQTQLPPGKAYILSSKDKLQVLSDCRDMDFRGRFNPSFNCGEQKQPRPDSLTLKTAISIMDMHEPDLMLIQFSGPDANAHANNYPGYIAAIQETDSLVYQLWQAIEQHPAYEGQTALFVTNDHGRHAEGHKDGFQSHGDGCESCRHISLLALGPDFQKGKVVDSPYEQIDIAPTIARLLQFNIPTYGGEPITPLVTFGEPAP